MFFFSLPAKGFHFGSTHRVKINGVYEQVLVEQDRVIIDPTGRNDVRAMWDVCRAGSLINFFCAPAEGKLFEIVMADYESTLEGSARYSGEGDFTIMPTSSQYTLTEIRHMLEDGVLTFIYGDETLHDEDGAKIADIEWKLDEIRTDRITFANDEAKTCPVLP